MRNHELEETAKRRRERKKMRKSKEPGITIRIV